MAAVNVTISGFLADKYGRWIRPVTLVGEASLTGVGIGGGPIEPGGGDPGAHPEHPIMLPGMPGWGDPHPAHPIALPPTDPPDVPPDQPPDTVVKPPPSDGGWGYVHPYGWAYFPGGSTAGPKR